MAFAYWWTAQALAGAFAFLAALVVYATGRTRAQPRRLALVFLLEAVALSLAATSAFVGDPARAVWLARGIQLCYFLLPLAYLNFLGTLQTKLVAWLRPRAVRIGLAALALGYLVIFAVRPQWYVSSVEPNVVPGNWTWVSGETPAWINALYTLQFLVPLFGLVVAFAALRLTPSGTIARARAVAYAIAFTVRDLSLITVLFVAGVIINDDSDPRSHLLYSVGLPMASVLPIAILTYGVLKTQLFDIDLRLHWSLQKGTVIGVVVAGFFIGEKLAEQFLSREFGWVIGSVLAGALVFLAPRLNRLGDKVATTALPKVEPTPAYISHKKLEVYKAAVETAQETGGIDARERTKLDRLREKLGLGADDCAAIESEVVAA